MRFRFLSEIQYEIEAFGITAVAFLRYSAGSEEGPEGRSAHARNV